MKESDLKLLKLAVKIYQNCVVGMYEALELSKEFYEVD